MRFFWWLKDHFVPSHRNAYRPHLLRRRALLFLLGVALVAEGALVANLLARQSGSSFLAAVIQSEILALTNAERAQNSVGTLKENTMLSHSAQAKADDMAARGYFAHQGPDGKQPWSWITAAGYNYRYAGENLAVRFVDSRDVVVAWMASPTHRANIVKHNYTEVGVGLAQGMYKGQPATFVVQHFGAPMAVAAAKPLPSAAPVAAAAAPPAPVVLGAEARTVFENLGTPPPSLSGTLARQLSRVLSEPQATTSFILGGVLALLALALAVAFFHCIQIQAHDLLLPGAAVAMVALTLMIINARVPSEVIHDSQAASVANAILVP